MSEHITHTTPTVRRLERSASGRMVAGVCAGLGRYFDLNPAFFRLGFVVLTLLGGAGILIYLAAVLVVPEEGKERSLAEQVLAERRERPWPLVGLALAAVALIVLLSRASVWPALGAGWLLVLVAGLVVLWASRSEGRAGKVLRILTGLAVVALATIVTAVVLAFSWFDVSLNNGVGDRVYTPATAAELKPAYRLGVGSLRLDLAHVAHVDRPTHVRADVGIGELRIVVPSGVPVAVDAHAKLGDVHALRQHDDGRNARVQTGSGHLLTVDANVGAGGIHVVRAR
jgi:phage shock protein PspC (stress-responsive transcriptional regulator)